MKKIMMSLSLGLALVLSACASGSAGASVPPVTSLSSPAANTAPAKELSQTSAAVSPAKSPANTTALTENVPRSTPLRVAALKGPTAMGLAPLIDQAQKGGSAQAYEFSLAASPDEILPKLIKGEVDLAAVPSNLAAVLYNNTKGEIQALAINTLGVLYICESGDSIKSLQDLKGRTLYASGKGSVPEYVLNYLLKNAGLDPETDVNIEYKSEHAEAAAYLASEEGALALLPQPFVAAAQSKNPAIRVALDLNAEWTKQQAQAAEPSALVMGVLVGRKDFIEKEAARLKLFMADYKASVAFVQENNDVAAELIGALDIVPAPVAKKALPQCNICLITGSEMRSKLGGFLQVLYEQNLKAVGGKVPDEAFYRLTE